MHRNPPTLDHCGAWHRAWRIGELPVLAVSVITITLLAGCASSASTGSSAPPPHSPATTADTPAAAARIFTSRHYRYTESLPAGWSSSSQAAQQWDGTGAPGNEDSVVDLFQGPGGVEAWAIAAPTTDNLTAYARTTIQASAAAHPCPSTPQTDQPITIGGTPARLLTMQCPAGSGFLVEIAVTVHDGTGFQFASQNPTGTTATDRAAFRAFLAGLRL